ncbi:DUF624 domain-containing protein [Candidatus Enterococcus mangumiae]|uniref:DUF624 domain-containing protein n=1 Tax=Candidatus Enterococcus mangumiae TaxID=2230878 RepID=A0ABZ2STN3_9ENTE|nr:DUF624 domain-containing protein [Enterococcus sp. DIV1094]MBO0490307.1 DUF624 domain-containing protein [Enterococcus sp. DIV1094]
MKLVETKWYGQLIQISDHILLGILWVVVSLPLVTVVSATTGVFTTLDKWKSGESGQVCYWFLQGFKRKFILQTLMSALTIIIFFSINRMFQESDVLLVISGYMATMVFTMFLLSWSYRLAKDETISLKQLFQESTLWVLFNFLRNLLCCGVLLVFMVLVFMFPPIIFVLAGGVWWLIDQLMGSRKRKGVWQ